MPITFAPPEPFAPGISAGYGATEQYDKTLPTLAGMQTHLGDLYLHAAQLRQQAAGQQGAASAASAQLGTQARLQENALTVQEREAASRNQLQAQEAQAAIQARFQENQQRAELGNWLNQQEMTQADNMALQRAEQGVSQVMNDDSLSPEDKQSLVGMLRSKIDPWRARQMLTQQKHQKMQQDAMNQQMQDQKSHELAQGKLDASTFEDRTKRVYDPDMMRDATAEATKEYDEANPNMMAMPGGAAIRASEIQQEAQARVAARGGATTYFQHEVGKWKAIEHPSHTAKAGGEKPFDISKAQKDAEAEAKIAYSDDKVDEKTGKPSATSEQLQKRSEYAAKVFERERAKHEGPKRLPFGGRFQQQGPPAGTTTGETGEQPKPLQIVEKASQEVASAPIPPEQKRQYDFFMGQQREAISKAGTYAKMSEEQKSLYDDRQRRMNQIRETAKTVLVGPPGSPEHAILRGSPGSPEQLPLYTPPRDSGE